MSKVTCDTKILDSLIRQTSKGDLTARAGFFEDSGRHPRSGATAYEVAAINNNGAPEANIPERPFVTDGSAEGEMKTELLMNTSVRKVHKGQTTFRKVHREAAEIQRDFILAQLILGPFTYVGNAQSTIDSKGGRDTPLLETGWLQKQIDIKYD